MNTLYPAITANCWLGAYAICQQQRPVIFFLREMKSA